MFPPLKKEVIMVTTTMILRFLSVYMHVWFQQNKNKQNKKNNNPVARYVNVINVSVSTAVEMQNLSSRTKWCHMKRFSYKQSWNKTSSLWS